MSDEGYVNNERAYSASQAAEAVERLVRACDEARLGGLPGEVIEAIERALLAAARLAAEVANG